MDSIVADKIRGVLFGQAIGDALGVGTEFLSRSEVAFTFPNGLRNYSDFRIYSKITNQFEQFEDPRWSPGDWTDDTDQMLCILDSILARRTIDIHDIAARLHHWAVTDAFGIGATVSAIVRHPEFLENPHRVSEEYWESKGRISASNGGVMRTSPLGIWQYLEPEKIRYNAEIVCRITHADPRCMGSCVAVCLAISRLLQGEQNLDKLVDAIAKEVEKYHPEMATYLAKTQADSLAVLDLDEGLNARERVTYSYTLKTLAAGFWALRNANTFSEGIEAIVHEGGDADTNAAVAGSLLGARFGYRAIKPAWIEGLIYKQELERRAEKLIELCDRT
ncbi:MAG: ADP-ribosylglycohydrolase family protein [Oscillatoriaceae cyanobacterium Prado104]|jgi:ADP-ribosylglycohydrolase|nr:ADP-ribosylglycohydrolase family protein [Oscillatoriaceae cyanobacterium Prado104]